MTNKNRIANIRARGEEGSWHNQSNYPKWAGENLGNEFIKACKMKMLEIKQKGNEGELEMQLWEGKIKITKLSITERDITEKKSKRRKFTATYKLKMSSKINRNGMKQS